MKKAVYVLLVGAVLFIGGYIMKESALNTKRIAGDAMTSRPGWKQDNEDQIRESEYLKTAGIIVVIGGGLWLIVLAIQAKKH
jgi:hypothetical protein